ncbi:CAP domain-containing protein [Noviherbaspirillum agri]
MVRSLRPVLPPLLAVLLLVSCGGGGGGGDDSTRASLNTNASIASLEPAAPAATGNTASDGLTWFNFRRQQLGLPAVTRNTTVDIAAQGHSDYQKLWGITHYQEEGRTGFTGECVYDNNNDPRCPSAKVSRLEAANYAFTQGSYAYGEVISKTSNPSGFDAAEGLIGAIYHRFVIFEPMFRQAGIGMAVDAQNMTYFTTNFVADGIAVNCATRGESINYLINYPFDNQQRVQRDFYSDAEVPDPVPGQNQVGYPISVHADIIANVSVQTFTVSPRGGSPLSVRTLTAAQDPQYTPTTAAAIVPTSVLAANTTYDVQFVGTVTYPATFGCPVLTKLVNRSWSFTTR